MAVIRRWPLGAPVRFSKRGGTKDSRLVQALRAGATSHGNENKLEQALANQAAAAAQDPAAQGQASRAVKAGPFLQPREEPVNEDFGVLSGIEDEDQSKSKKECKNVRCKPTIMQMMKSYQRAEALRRHIESTAKILESYQRERAKQRVEELGYPF